jgi:hypothetical protein
VARGFMDVGFSMGMTMEDGQHDLKCLRNCGTLFLPLAMYLLFGRPSCRAMAMPSLTRSKPQSLSLGSC